MGFQMSYPARRNMNSKLKKTLTASWLWEPSLYRIALQGLLSPETQRSMLLLLVSGTSPALTQGGAAASLLLKAGWLASPAEP